MDKKKVRWLLLIVSASFVTLYNIYKQGIAYLGTLGLEMIPILIVAWIFMIHLPREKAYKLSQSLGFIGFFLYLVLPTTFFSKYLFVYGVMMVALSLLLKRDIPFKNSGKTLDEKIKNQLKIRVKSKVMNLPKRIGGFVMPILPFFYVTSKYWKGNLKKEAIIHENVHLYYLQNGWLIGVVLGIAVITSQAMKIISEAVITPFIIFLFVLSAVLFEQVTFIKTHEIGQSMGIVTREWNGRIGFRYFIIYAFQFAGVFFLWQGLKFIWTISIGYGKLFI